MAYVRKIVYAIITLGAVAGAAYLIFWVGNQLLTGLLELNRDVAVAVIGALGTVGAVIWNHRSLKKREIAEAQRPEKMKMYTKFMEDLVVKTLKQTREGKVDEEWVRDELQEFFFEWTGKAIFWSSPGFIRAYKKFRRLGREEDPSVILFLDKMLQEVRKDLGHTDWSLADGDLIGLFLTDPETVRELSRTE